MEGQFYRKQKSISDFKQKALKLFKSKRFVVRFVLGSIVAGVVLFGNHGVLQRVRLQHEKSELTQKLEYAELESKRLQAEVKALDGDRNAIEKAAREKHGMIREGETVYRVNKK